MSGRRHGITVIMESRRNGPQLSSRHDDDDDDEFTYKENKALKPYRQYCILLCNLK